MKDKTNEPSQKRKTKEVKEKLDLYTIDVLYRYKYTNINDYINMERLFEEAKTFILSEEQLVNYIYDSIFSSEDLVSHIIYVTFFTLLILSKNKSLATKDLKLMFYVCLFHDVGLNPIFNLKKDHNIILPKTEKEINLYKCHSVLGVHEAKKYLCSRDYEMIKDYIYYHHKYKNGFTEEDNTIFIDIPSYYDEKLLTKLYNDKIFKIMQVVDCFSRLLLLDIDGKENIKNNFIIETLTKNLNYIYIDTIKLLIQYISPYKIDTKIKFNNQIFKIKSFSISNKNPTLINIKTGETFILDNKDKIEFV